MIRSARLVTIAVLLMAGIGVAQPRPRRLPPRRYPPPRPTAVVTPPVVPDPVPAPPVTTVIVAVPPPAALATPAPVQPLPDRDVGNYVSLGFLGGYGSPTGRYASFINDFANGIGGWLAYTFKPRLTLGVEAIHHFGSNEGLSAGMYSSTNLWIGGHFGYEGIIGPVMLRPYVLFGGMREHRECATCSRPVDESITHAAFGAGIGIHLLLSALFIGVDGRVTSVLEIGATGQVFGTIGIRIR